MIELASPPALILPSHYEGGRPAIIRTEADPQRFFPARLSRDERIEALLPGLATVKTNRVTGGPSLTYIGSAADPADGTTYNFGNFTIPAAGLVVVGTAARNTSGSPTLSAISIGGTGGSLLVAPSGNTNPTGFASRSVAAGDHAVSVTFSSGVTRASCHVWLLQNLLSTTPVDSEGFNTGTSSTSLVLTADISAGGFALYVGMKAGTTEGVNFSSATKRYDAATEIQMWAGDKYSAVALANHAETISYTTSTIRSGSVVTFR